MQLIKWNPMNLSSFLEDDWTFPTLPVLNRLGQGLNLYETSDTLTAEAALPGVSEENIDVTIDEGVVHISGSASDIQEEKSQRKYYMSSMASSYNYSFKLPEGMIADEEPKAELDNGILTLTFKKTEKAAPKKVKVAKVKKELGKTQ